MTAYPKLVTVRVVRLDGDVHVRVFGEYHTVWDVKCFIRETVNIPCECQRLVAIKYGVADTVPLAEIVGLRRRRLRHKITRVLDFTLVRLPTAVKERTHQLLLQAIDTDTEILNGQAKKRCPLEPDSRLCRAIISAAFTPMPSPTADVASERGCAAEPARVRDAMQGWVLVRFINPLNGNITRLLQAQRSSRIRDIKGAVSELELVPMQCQRLLLGTEEVSDECVLGELVTCEVTVIEFSDVKQRDPAEAEALKALRGNLEIRQISFYLCLLFDCYVVMPDGGTAMREGLHVAYFRHEDARVRLQVLQAVEDFISKRNIVQHESAAKIVSIVTSVFIRILSDESDSGLRMRVALESLILLSRASATDVSCILAAYTHALAHEANWTIRMSIVSVMKQFYPTAGSMISSRILAILDKTLAEDTQWMVRQRAVQALGVFYNASLVERKEHAYTILHLLGRVVADDTSCKVREEVMNLMLEMGADTWNVTVRIAMNALHRTVREDSLPATRRSAAESAVTSLTQFLDARAGFLPSEFLDARASVLPPELLAAQAEVRGILPSEFLAALAGEVPPEFLAAQAADRGEQVERPNEHAALPMTDKQSRTVGRAVKRRRKECSSWKQFYSKDLVPEAAAATSGGDDDPRAMPQLPFSYERTCG